MKTQIPVYRAKTLDGELVEGWPMLFANSVIMSMIHSKDVRIDPETLVISFDNGQVWFNIEQAELAFRNYMKQTGYEGETK